MTSGPPDLRRTVTERLDLAAVRHEDLDDLFALHSDPRVWEHFPQGIHHHREQTARDVAAYAEGWHRDGLAYWTARRRDDGAFVGIGGVRVVAGGRAWNTYYRLRPEQQGQGFATELARAGRDAAVQVRPELPVIAFLLEHNAASKATAERAGLTLAWRGPDAGNENPDAVRLVYSDRPLPAQTLGLLTGL